MADTYYLTTTASDLGTGDNWSNRIQRTIPGTTTLVSSIANNSTENDLGFTPSGEPGDQGTSGNYSASVEINATDGSTTLDLLIVRVNSSGTEQGSPVGSDGGAQTVAAGTLTYNWTSPSLGTWTAGDRLKVYWRWVNSDLHGQPEDSTQDIGSAGTTITAPWTFAVGGPAAGLRTLALTGAGV